MYSSIFKAFAVFETQKEKDTLYCTVLNVLICYQIKVRIYFRRAADVRACGCWQRSCRWRDNQWRQGSKNIRQIFSTLYIARVSSKIASSPDEGWGCLRRCYSSRTFASTRRWARVWRSFLRRRWWRLARRGPPDTAFSSSGWQRRSSKWTPTRRPKLAPRGTGGHLFPT